MKHFGLIASLALVGGLAVFGSVVLFSLSSGSAASRPVYTGPNGRLVQLNQLYSHETVPLCGTLDAPPHYSVAEVHLQIQPAHFGQLGPVRMLPAYVNSGLVNGKPKLATSPNRQKFCATYTAPKVRHFSAVSIRLVVRHQLIDYYPLAILQSPPRP